MSKLDHKTFISIDSENTVRMTVSYTCPDCGGTHDMTIRSAQDAARYYRTMANTMLAIARPARLTVH